MCRRYLCGLAACAVATFVAIWAYVVLLPMAVLDHEYPVWLAKHALVDACDLGSVFVLGDSRAEVGIIPALLSMPVTNLTFGGGGPIEAYYAAEAAIRCPQHPTRAVVSITLGKFSEADVFWDRTVRFGFLSRHELNEVAAIADQLHDRVLRDSPNRTGIPSAIRSWLYPTRFPPAYFNSLANSGVGFRYFRNRQVEAAVIKARGQHFLQARPGDSLIGEEAAMRSFTIAPLLDHYFDRLLALLTSHGVEVDFITVPISETDFDHTRPEVSGGFAAYLDGYARRYPGFHVLGSPLPSWPDRLFGDVGQHLTPHGATLFNHWLAGCLAHGACDEATMRRVSGIDTAAGQSEMATTAARN